MSSNAEQRADQGIKSGKGYTAPKGRPTVHRTADRNPRRFSSTVEWTLVIVIALVVLAAFFYFGRDFRSGGTGGAQESRIEHVQAVESVG